MPRVTAAFAAAAATLLLQVGCDRLSPEEKQVVGEWKTWSIHGGAIVKTIRADHTWTATGPHPSDEPVHGRWRVEGSEIVYQSDPARAGQPSLPEVREPIQNVIEEDRATRS